ncbi:MAG: hypothetical protein Q4G26_15250 [Paracoccus sp. (in: a-proteobacteria)]|nr:hypothetical protein [Paracoccus sp. (in: a-proteobacteria)]
MTELAARWGCLPADIAGWSIGGSLPVMTGIAPCRSSSKILAGFVEVPVTDILPLFRRCGSGPREYVIRRVRPADMPEWQFILGPDQGITVALDDLIVMAQDVLRFEDEHGLFARNHGAGRGSSRYDWDAFFAAVVKRIHDAGLPATQNALVAEMQEWFMAQSPTGEAPDESTIRRRLTPVWRVLQA